MHAEDRRGFGPFTTALRLRRPDGTEVEYSAWHHRKGHGLVDERTPRLSSLAITPDGRDDGFLTAAEIMDLAVPADLVVLSA